MTEFCEYTTPLTADEMTALGEIIASVKARVEKRSKRTLSAEHDRPG